ncbi:MAG: hypothetical protein RQ862_03240 [Candidatus Caldarchaeales archaeon]|nr:hypothetical protein [Candidatus Caldarchaeales archaeon]
MANATSWMREAQVIELEAFGRFGVVKDTVVTGIKGFAQRLSWCVPRYPMPEVSDFVEKGGKVSEPFGNVVHEDRTCRFRHPNQLMKPRLAPIQILVQSLSVVVGVILLAQIERRVGECHVHAFVRQLAQNSQTISFNDTVEKVR